MCGLPPLRFGQFERPEYPYANEPKSNGYKRPPPPRFYRAEAAILQQWQAGTPVIEVVPHPQSESQRHLSLEETTRSWLA